MTYDETIEYYVNRGFETRNMNLGDLVDAENLDKIQLGTLNVLTCNELTNAMVACKDSMILAREYYNEEQDKIIAEYAIYRQEDRDGHNLMHSLNANAIYTLDYLGDQEFENVGAAIAYAVELLYFPEKYRKNYDDPIDMLMNLTNPHEDWTLEDAGRILGEAEAQGWRFAPDVDAQYILDLYNDMEGDDEHD